MTVEQAALTFECIEEMAGKNCFGSKLKTCTGKFCHQRPSTLCNRTEQCLWKSKPIFSQEFKHISNINREVSKKYPVSIKRLHESHKLFSNNQNKSKPIWLFLRLLLFADNIHEKWYSCSQISIIWLCLYAWHWRQMLIFRLCCRYWLRNTWQPHTRTHTHSQQLLKERKKELLYQKVLKIVTKRHATGFIHYACISKLIMFAFVIVLSVSQVRNLKPILWFLWNRKRSSKKTLIFFPKSLNAFSRERVVIIFQSVWFSWSIRFYSYANVINVYFICNMHYFQ